MEIKFYKILNFENDNFKKIKLFLHCLKSDIAKETW